MTVSQKHEALTNALRSFKFADKYFIENADRRVGHKFAIAYVKYGALYTVTGYMTYEEMNAYLRGYNAAENNPLN